MLTDSQKYSQKFEPLKLATRPGFQGTLQFVGQTFFRENLGLRKGFTPVIDTTIDTTVSRKLLPRNVYVAGILWGGAYWNSQSSPTRLHYSFWNRGTESFDDGVGDFATVAYDWTATEKASVVNVLNAWATVANLQFVEATDNQQTTTLSFYKVDRGQFGEDLGLFNPPSEPGMGIGYFNQQGDGWDVTGMAAGSLGYVTLLHEIGHGLGLAHPHDDGGGSPIYPGVKGEFSPGLYQLNQGLYTTMSYNDGFLDTPPGTHRYGYQGTPMAFDIAAIQYLYGANLNYRTGNDRYDLPTVNQTGTLTQAATMYSCIWDAGGIDTISATGAGAGAVIDLNAATLNARADGAGAGGFLSSVQGIVGGLTIAHRVVIERAEGGNFKDLLIGNGVNNDLSGFAGNDRMDGGAGRDTLTGGMGKDMLIGNRGGDQFVYANLAESTLAKFDVIEDYRTGEVIDAPATVTGRTLRASVGTAARLTPAAVAAVLSTSAFPGNRARAFTVSQQAGLFIALNDATPGFNANTDAVIYLQNYRPGSAVVIA